MIRSARRHVALVWTAVVALIGVATADLPSQWGLVATMTTLAWITVRSVPAAAAWPIGLVTAVAAGASATAVRLGVSPVKTVAVTAGELILLVVTAHVVRRLPAGGRLEGRGFLLGGGAILAAVVVRHPLSHATAGNLGWTTGTVSFAGLSVQAGEVTRLAVVAGLLVALRHASSRNRRRIAYALATAYAVPLMFIDQGPALLTIIGCLAATQMSGRSWTPTIAQVRRVGRVGLPVGAVLMVAVLAVPLARTKIVGRMTSLLSPDDSSQIGDALNGLRQAGWFARPDTEFASFIAEARHDMAFAALGSELGIVALLLVVTALLTAIVMLFGQSARSGGARADVSCALLLMMLVQTAWSVLCNVGLLPITGISAPVVAVTGASALATALVFGTAAGVAGRTEHSYASPRGWPTSLVRVAVPVTVIATVASGVGFALSQKPPTWNASLAMPRGDILGADGFAMSGPMSEDGTRTPLREAYWFTGSYMKHSRSATGLELGLTRDLTCGGSPSFSERLRAIIQPIPCHLADVMTSIDSELQEAAEAALKGVEGAVVVLDATDGQIKAMSSSFKEATPEGPPGSTFKIVTGTAALLEHADMTDAPRTLLDLGGESMTNIDRFTCSDSSIATAVAESCNTVIGYGALQVGQDALRRVARTYFGVDSRIGAEVQTTSALDVSTGLDARLTRGGLARTAIGQQELRATTLGVATFGEAIAASANGETALKPRLVVGVCDAGTLRRHRSEALAPKRIDRDVARKMLAAMGRGARGGSAASLRAAGHTLATKTGTADDGVSSDQTRSWLVAVVDGRWVVAAQVFVPYSTHQNLAVPLVQQAINGMGPDLDRDYRCPR